MKLIEADKVKRVMKDYWKAQVDKALKLIDGNEANNRINSCLEYNHDLLKAIDELPSAEPEQQWIPVEERLPEPWDLVLVTDSCKNVSVCQMALNPSDGWYDQCENWMYFSTSVIAWMPLPEYYKDGEHK